jgi:hypothetical protein
MLGQCRLCRATANLRRSHVLPAWAFKRVRQRGGGKPPVMIEYGTRRLSNKQDREYLLCHGCELRFCRWEDHVARLALQRNGTSPAFDAVTLLGQRGPGQETVADGSALGDELALFAASVVWRSAVVSRPDVRLGPYIDEFHAFVSGASPDLPHASLVANVIDPYGGTRAAETASYPATFVEDGYERHQFMVPGLLFTFWTGEALSLMAEYFSFLHTRRVWIVDGHKYAGHMQWMHDTATPVVKGMRHRP